MPDRSNTRYFKSPDGVNVFATFSPFLNGACEFGYQNTKGQAPFMLCGTGYFPTQNRRLTTHNVYQYSRAAVSGLGGNQVGTVYTAPLINQ